MKEEGLAGQDWELTYDVLKPFGDVGPIKQGQPWLHFQVGLDNEPQLDMPYADPTAHKQCRILLPTEDYDELAQLAEAEERSISYVAGPPHP